MRIELLYDYPRLEEKLIIERLRALDSELFVTNINNRPMTVGESVADVSIVRVVSMYKALHSAAIRESGGALTINSSYTVMICGDKVVALSRLRQAGLTIPRSIIAMDSDSAMIASRIFRGPFVDKPPIGSWGRLVTLVKDEATWRSVLEHRQLMPSQQLRVHILQEFIGAGGRDVRTIVIGGKVLGAMYRVSADNEWRTNVALGGRTQAREMDSELEEISLKAAEAVKGAFVSVDILEGADGALYVNEVNGVPEFRGFIEATGIDVAGELARYVSAEARR